ncbi:hypothetical protein Tco_0644405 [Tanacetum coccineum]
MLCIGRMLSQILEACHNGTTGEHHGANLTAKRSLIAADAGIVKALVFSVFVYSITLSFKNPQLNFGEYRFPN